MKSKFTLLSSAVTLSALSLLAPSAVKAGDIVNLEDPASPYNSIYNLTPSRYVRTATNLMLGIAGVLSFFYLLWGGIQWITAGGDKDAVEKAKKKITGALIGLVITFSVYVFLFIIRVLFNVNLVTVNISNI